MTKNKGENGFTVLALYHQLVYLINSGERDRAHAEKRNHRKACCEITWGIGLWFFRVGGERKYNHILERTESRISGVSVLSSTRDRSMASTLPPWYLSIKI